MLRSQVTSTQELAGHQLHRLRRTARLIRREREPNTPKGLKKSGARGMGARSTKGQRALRSDDEGTNFRCTTNRDNEAPLPSIGLEKRKKERV